MTFFSSQHVVLRKHNGWFATARFNHFLYSMTSTCMANTFAMTLPSKFVVLFAEYYAGYILMHWSGSIKLTN